MIKTTTATTKSKTKKVLKVYENIKYRSDPCCKMLQNLEKQKKKIGDEDLPVVHTLTKKKNKTSFGINS